MSGRCLLVIRIRGGLNAPRRVEDTLRMLRVHRNNTATIIDDRPDYLGMLQRVKDWVTWGEARPETIKMLLEKRGRTIGGRPLDDGTLGELGFSSIGELAEAIAEGRTQFRKLEVVKPFFRLHPPKRGFKKSIKRSYTDRGELGYRGEAINELAERMC
jgi:large subunit ribosomal protein L30